MSSEQYTEGRFLTPSECAFFFKIFSGKRTCRANDLSGKWLVGQVTVGQTYQTHMLVAVDIV